MMYDITLENDDGDLITESIESKSIRGAVVKLSDLYDEDYVVVSIKVSDKAFDKIEIEELKNV